MRDNFSIQLRDNFKSHSFGEGTPISQNERLYNLVRAIRLASMHSPSYLIPDATDFTENGMLDYLTAILPREFQFLDPHALSQIVRIVGQNYGWADDRLSNLLATLPGGRNFRVTTKIEEYMGWALNMAARKKFSCSHTLDAHTAWDFDRLSNGSSYFARYAEKNDAIGYSADLRSDARMMLPKWANRINIVPVTLFFDDEVSCTLAKIRFPQYVNIPDDI